MKKLFYLSLLLSISFAARSMNVPVKGSYHYASVDTPRQKIVRPTTPMTEAQVKDIEAKMRQKRNDAEKVAVVKDNLKDGITVAQLTILLNQFNTDDNKLAIAEFAYPYVTNYKKILDLQDLFSDDKHKNMLEDFVRKYK